MGELISSTDAKTRPPLYYDLLGRMIQRTAPDQTSYWVYDAAANGIGKLAFSYANRLINEHVYNYDSLGRANDSYLFTPNGTLG